MGFEDLYIYAFFPKLVLEEGQATTFLTAKQEELWLNRAFLPAIAAEYNYKDAVLQHFPASYQSAKADALARSTEKTVYNQGGLPSRQQLLQYMLQPGRLAGIWSRVLAAIDSDDQLQGF